MVGYMLLLSLFKYGGTGALGYTFRGRWQTLLPPHLFYLPLTLSRALGNYLGVGREACPLGHLYRMGAGVPPTARLVGILVDSLQVAIAGQGADTGGSGATFISGLFKRQGLEPWGGI